MRLGFLLFLVSILSACSTHSVSQGTTVGGLGGAAVGAGTGALVGSLISNGDVGASALLGTAIGIPVGAAIGAYYISSENNAELDANQRVIEFNREVILTREDELNSLREEVIRDSFVIEPDTSLDGNLYVGPTLGNYYRQ